MIPESLRKYVYYEENDIILLHGDCLDILPHLEKDSIDLVLTDPPYNKVNRSSNGLRNLDKGLADSLPANIDNLLPYLITVCEGSFYIFCGTEQVSSIRSYLVSAGLSTRHGFWEKTNPSPMNGEHIYLSAIENVIFAKHKGATFNGKCLRPIWKTPVPENIGHPTSKPLPMIKGMMHVSSNVGDTILDPFLGSGTTAVAAKQLGRKCIGIELEKKYLDIAIERLRQEVLF
jgi:site-specific DNA-methyltransferase (adenine-specific)